MALGEGEGDSAPWAGKMMVTCLRRKDGKSWNESGMTWNDMVKRCSEKLERTVAFGGSNSFDFRCGKVPWSLRP